MVKRGRAKKLQASKSTSVEGESIPSLKQVFVKGRVTKTRLESAPLSPPPGFAPSDASPSLSRYRTRNSLKTVLDRCNAMTSPLRSPIRNVKNARHHTRKYKQVLDRCNAMTATPRSPIQNVKLSYPSCATGDFPAHLTTGMGHATEENVANPVQAKLEDQSVPMIHAVLGVENQELGVSNKENQEQGVSGVENQELEEQCERLASLPEVVVENNAPPRNADVVLNTNATGPENRSIGSGARPTKSGSVNLTRIGELMNDCSSDDEVESRPDHMLVTINGYRVKEEAAPVLQRIFHKYGDIAKQSSFSSVNISSSLMEFVCDIYRKLEAADFRSITTKELQSMLAEVRDLESAKVDVGWLRQRLNDISDAKQLIQVHCKLKEAETRNLVAMETKKKALGELKEELAACIATCRVLQGRIQEKEHELGVVDCENESISKRIKQSYVDTKAKVKGFLHQSLVRDLL